MSSGAMTAKDYFRWKNITDARISPDGKKVVYVVQEFDMEKDKSKNSLWLIRLDRDRTPLRLTNSPNDASPRWAPDSERIAFVSGREQDKGQLYVIDINGGEAQQIKTDVSPTGAPRWSPDGQRIAFLAPADRKFDGPRYPGEPEEVRPVHKEGDDRDKKFAESVKVVTDFYYRADGKGLIYHKRPQLFVVDVASGECRQLTDACEPLNSGFAWNAQGTALAYSENLFDVAAALHRTVVREVNAATKSDCELFTFDGSASTLEYSVDSSALFFTATSNAAPMGVASSRIYQAPLHGQTFPLAAASIVCLTAGLDRHCSGLIVSPCGKSLRFLQETAGTVVPCRLGLADRMIEPVAGVNLPTTTVLDLAKTGELLLIASDFATPPQVYLVQSGKSVRLTNVNEDLLKEFPPCTAEKIRYRGADGWDVEGWVVRPRDYEPGRRYPTILSVHGGPTGAYYDAWLLQFQLLAQQGFALVFTNPHGSTGYGEAFTAGVIRDWGGKDYQDIMAGLDKAIGMGIVDENRVGIMGWSYGGYMTCWTVTQTDRFKAAIGGANISNVYTLYGGSDIGAAYDEALLGAAAFDDEELYMSRSAMRHVRNVKTPILLLHGEADIRCPIDQSEQFYTALKRLGKAAVFVRYPGQYHPIVKPSYQLDRWQRSVAWFKHYLG